LLVLFSGRFKSKARPYWVQFRDASGAQIDCVMKSGDDLRQDQVCFLLKPIDAVLLCICVCHEPVLANARVASAESAVAVVDRIKMVLASQVLLGMLECFNRVWKREGAAGNTFFAMPCHLMLKKGVCLPRQARDKHRNRLARKKGAFSALVGVMHQLNGGGLVPVRAPLYRCIACGTDRGFVEMLPRCAKQQREKRHGRSFLFFSFLALFI
jgi:predicted secreted protein